MTKWEYLYQFKADKYKDYDPIVINFIANILYNDRNRNDDIRSFFRAGYCYHFAVILENIFQRGKLCITEPYGHIVWVDTNGLAYDIEGPYLPSEHECERLTDITFLGDLIYDFIHIPGKDYIAPQDFHDWAQFMKMSDIYAMTSIYREIPREEVKYNISLEKNVYNYWLNNKEKLQKKFQG